jgi:3D (Asp-Asp-Asp) domain-containing protein
MRRAELALLATVAGCTPHAPADLDGGARDLAGSDGAAAADLAHPAIDGGLGTLKGPAKLTYYYLAEQSDYSGANDTALCDVSTAVIATVPKAFADALAIEGSGKLTDGRVVNIGGNCACSSGMTTCYVVLDAAMYPWGVGVMSRALAPYRSIAVDPAFIAFGTKVYVPEFDGKTMPGSYGFVHDGCLVAADTGGAIVGAHIDFFVGQKSSYLTLDAMLNLTSVTTYVSPPRCP